MDTTASGEVGNGGSDWRRRFVPVAEYLAKVDPEVHKEIEDHIRVRPEGMTVEEAKTPPEYEAKGEGMSS